MTASETLHEEVALSRAHGHEVVRAWVGVDMWIRLVRELPIPSIEIEGVRVDLDASLQGETVVMAGSQYVAPGLPPKGLP